MPGAKLSVSPSKCKVPQLHRWLACRGVTGIHRWLLPKDLMVPDLEKSQLDVSLAHPFSKELIKLRPAASVQKEEKPNTVNFAIQEDLTQI